MADFFEPKDPDKTGQNVENLEGNEPETITVGDKQYTQEELNDLVGLGQIAREVEQRYSTKLDRVYPEYTKSRQELKELKEQLEELKNQKPQKVEEMDEAQIIQAQKAARQLGILTKEDIADLGLMTKEQVQGFINEYRAGEKLLEQSRTLENKYDGKDGRPVYKTEDILEYMQETGIKEPETAYKIKYEEALSTWREKKTADARKSGLVTETTSTAGNKLPQNVKITRDNLDRMVSEALEGKL